MDGFPHRLALRRYNLLGSSRRPVELRLLPRFFESVALQIANGLISIFNVLTRDAQPLGLGTQVCTQRAYIQQAADRRCKEQCADGELEFDRKQIHALASAGAG